MDEATSALDHETEKLVMDSIMGLEKDITILIIAHRTTTLAGCDIITELKNRQITYIGNYNNLMKQNQSTPDISSSPVLSISSYSITVRYSSFPSETNRMKIEFE